MRKKLTCLVTAAILLLPSLASTEPDNCRGVPLDQAQTIEAPCKGFFVPEARANKLLEKEALLEGEQAANELLQEENSQLIETDKKNKKKLMKRKIWKGITIGMALQGIIIIAIVAL